MSREEQWAERIAAYRKSGKTIPAFCQENGIKTSTLKYWLYSRKVEGALAAKESQETYGITTKWLELPVKTKPTSIILTVGDVQIKVERGFDPALLREIIKTVSRC